MRADRLDRIAAAEPDHFWFSSRRTVVIDEVARRRPDHRSVRVLDVGCGTGSMLDAMGANAGSVGLDPLGHRLPQRPDGPRFGRARAEALPVRTETIDLILALDVLEHVDDRVAMSEVARCLKAGGVFIGTVPAGPRLWSYRDDDAGHLRRYRRAGLQAAVSSGGLIVEQCRAFQGALMPLLVASRLAGRKSPKLRNLEDQPPQSLNRVLGRVTRLEHSLARRGVRPPVGSSLLITASKPR